MRLRSRPALLEEFLPDFTVFERKGDKLNKKILAICDCEDRYARGLMEYMSEKPHLPFRIHVVTDAGHLLESPQKEDIECLLVSESIYGKWSDAFTAPHIIILSESGNILDNTLHHIKKYQSCENIYREVLAYYTKESDAVDKKMRVNAKGMKIIGIYTPLGRCLQTTFAFTLGQILSRSCRTLYLNFERYSGLSELLKREFHSDISDLMYYLECAKEKLAYKIDTIVETVNGLDFIPPAQIFQNVAGIKADQWEELFGEMAECTEYEYILLDLTDGMLDLWEVLRNCDLVYTITKGDTVAMAKMYQYEKLLRSMEYEDILNKTRKCRFPVFRELSVRFDELTAGELASYVKEQILPDITGWSS